MLGLSLVLFLACCPCYVRADLSVGAPMGTDPFSIIFDGYGNATVSVYQGATYTETGYMAPDQSGLSPSSSVLTYDLPEQVTEGGLNILSPVFPGTTITGNLYFYDDLNGGGHMEFLLPLGTGQLASTGTTDFGISPLLAQNTDGKFIYTAGNGDPSTTDFYHGTGIPIVPEPNTFIVMGFGLASLLGYSCWRRKQVAAVR